MQPFMWARKSPYILRVGAILAGLALGLVARSARAQEHPAATGTLRVDCPIFQVKLLPEGAPPGDSRLLTVEGREGRAALAPGRYRLREWEIETADSQGRSWKVAGDGLVRPIEIRAGEETRVALVTPLHAHLSVYPGSEPPLFRVTYTGAMEQRVREITVDGDRPLPQLRVLDARGKVAAALPFQPG